MIQQARIFLLNKLNVFAILIALFFTFIHLPRFFEAYFPPLIPSPYLWWGLDSSWILTLNYINNIGLNWGSDFAFTYGPLSYLSTRLAWGTNGISLIVFDIFFFINLFYIYFISLKNGQNKIITFLLVIGYSLLTPVHIGPPIALILLIFLVFWVRASIDKPKFIYYLFQIVLLFLLFFIKFNTGLIAFPLFFLGIMYNLISKKEKFYWLLIYAICPIILILVSSKFLNVDLIPYIKSALEIISGYNDIMYLEHEISIRLFALFVLFSTLFILAHKVYLERKTDLIKSSTIFILYFVPIFVLYKSAFVRGLETDFFIYSILLILTLKDLHNYKKYSNYVLAICLMVSFYIVYFNDDTKTSFESVNKIDKYYFTGIKNFTPISGLHIIPNNNKIPNSIIEKIGTKTVDIYPWNAQLLFENNLNFSPRPVFQSYTAYTPYLEEKNFEFYNSYSKAPEFVIYEYLAIDGRYPLYDEPKVNLCLLKNYNPVELFDFQDRKFILLQKRKDFKPIKLIMEKEYAMMIESPLVPMKGVYYEVGVYNSLIGKGISIIDHAPEIKLEVKTNIQMEYRTGKMLLESGLFSDIKINTTEDFYSLFFIDSLAKLEKVKYYNFKPRNTTYFTDKIRITEYKITQ
jgi:hypothetical protein